MDQDGIPHSMELIARSLDQIITESSQDDTNSLDPSETSGGFGQYNATLVGQVDDERFILSTLPEGTVSNVEYSDGLITLTADSDLSKLNRWYSVPPHVGSLTSYLYKINDIAGTSISTNINIPNMTIPGFEGNVWEHFKQFLSAYNLQLGSDGEQVGYPFRNEIAVDEHLTTVNWSINAQESTEWISVLWRNILRLGDNVELFAPDRPLSVEAGETVVQEIEIDGSLLSVNQPICFDYVPANTDYSGTSGVYCVAGKDGKPILASRWKAGGGDLRVELTDDPGVIRVIITGSKIEDYAPYQIAATAGSSSFYNSLHVTGSGMLWQEKSFKTHTGAPRATSAKETVTEITNPFVVGYDMAVDVAQRAVKGHSGGLKQVSFTVSPLGIATGQHVRMFDGIHRILSISHSPNNTSVTLEPDTRFSDWNARNPGMTIASFNAKFQGKRFIDFNTRSLQ